MILDWVWDNFGLLEYLLCIELVVLLAAAFFYQVAKLIARTHRQDPLVKFYRVFWQSFFSSVTSIRDLDLMQMEQMARARGVAMVGDMDTNQLSRLDAPDLGSLDGLDEIAKPASPPSDMDETPPPTAVKPIGRTGPEDEDRVRPKKGGESRELKYARLQREKREAETEAAENRAEASDRIAVTRDSSEDRNRTDLPHAEIKRAAVSRLNVRIVPMKEKDRIVGYQDGEIVIDVVYAPEAGQANGVVIDLISSQIDVRPYQIALIGGHYKVRKTFQVSGLDQPTLDARIAAI